jgi:hypothetical protein
MSRRRQGRSRPADVIGNVVRIVRIATRQDGDTARTVGKTRLPSHQIARAARRDVTPERRAEIARQSQRSAVLGVDTPDQARAWASPEARQGYAISPIRLRGYLGFSRALTSVWNGLLLFRLGASATLLARFLMSAGFRIGGLRARALSTLNESEGIPRGIDL